MSLRLSCPAKAGHLSARQRTSVVTGSSAYADDDRRVWLAIQAVCATLILILAVTSSSADTLRVGKAGREAFSFVPADIGAKARSDDGSDQPFKRAERSATAAIRRLAANVNHI